MAKYYAWSRILYGAELNEDGTKKGDLVLEPGEEASASGMKLTDEQFQELVDSEAVRDYQFPDSLQDPLASPNQLIAQGLAEADTVASTVGTSPELVQAYGEQQKKLAKAPEQGTEVKK